ncbi:MAG: hypothetical protein ABSG57_10585, partial [Candidatus Bathyarchaeia archaeon]
FSPSGKPRHIEGLKTRMCLKTVPEPENRNYDHFTPISGQGSARRELSTLGFRTLETVQTTTWLKDYMEQ